MNAALLIDAARALRRPWGAWIAPAALALALAAALLVAWLAQTLASPDPSIPEPERIVLLDFKGNPPGQPTPWFTASPVFFGPALKRMGVPLQDVARVSEESFTLRNRAGLPQRATLLVADPALVPLFGIKALHGDVAATLQRRDAVAITERLAQQLWGDQPPAQALGRSLPLLDGRAFVVGAVLPTPDPRSPLPMLELLAGYDSQANSRTPEQQEWPFMINGRVFARLGPGVTADQVGPWMRAAALANPGISQLPPEWTRGREAAFFRGLPLLQLPFAGEAGELRWQRVQALGAAAALLLLLAAINGANLRAAELLRRQAETALRRSVGARRRDLLLLWLAEALGPALLAAGVAVLLSWWLGPWLAQWLGVWLPDLPPWPLLAATVGVSVLLSVLQMLLPAPLALRQTPARALQARTAGEGPWGRRLRQGLLSLQLLGALLLVALSGVLMQQHTHLLRADRGYAPEHRLVLDGLADGEPPTALIEALTHLPQVRDWAWGDSLPTGMGPKDYLSGFIGPSGQQHTLRSNAVAPRFFRVWGMRVLAGDPLTGAQGDARVVLDAQAARLLGFASPAAAVGQWVRGGGAFMQAGTDAYRVAAVVDDLRFEAGQLPAQPKLFVLRDEAFGLLTLHASDDAALEAAVLQTWQRLSPDRLLQVDLASRQRAAACAEEQRLTGLLLVVAALALAVAAMGTQALMTDTLRRRRREIVLLRLHGAPSGAIAHALLREFLPPLCVAAVLALPLAAWLGWHYLAGYADRVALLPGLGVPLLAALAVILPVLLLTLAQQLRTALSIQPVEALE